MSQFQNNLLATANSILTRYEELGVAGQAQRDLTAFVLQSRLDSRLDVDTHSRIWRYLDRVASGVDIIQEVGGAGSIGPRSVLLYDTGNKTFRVYAWDIVMDAWTQQPIGEQDENPYTRFRMGGNVYVLANPDEREKVREIMKEQHKVVDPLSLSFEIKTFDGAGWVPIKDEEFVLKVFKLCISQGYRRNTRQPWVIRVDGLGSLTVSSQNNVRTITANSGTGPLRLQIFGANQGDYGMSFTEPVVNKAVEPADPSDNDVCNICFAYGCACNPSHIPAVSGCGQLIHRCCFFKYVESQRAVGNRHSDCIFCRRHIDMDSFPDK